MTTLQEQQNRILNFSSKELDDIKQKSKEEGIIIGREHSTMSGDTSKHFDTMDTKMDKFEEKVDALKDNFAELRTEMKVGFEKLPLLDDILKHAEYTNGKIAELSKWRERVIGMSQIGMIVVVPLMGWALYMVANMDKTIRTVAAQATSDALSKVELQVTK